jgi:hypothetical protein
MSSASAKIADSEIKASGGSFDLKTGEYGLNFSLVNTHAGPADMFGDIILSGVMDKQRGGSKYSGTVTLDNFWINRYKLSRSEFNYFIHNKTFEFKSARLKPGMFKSSGTVAFTDGVSVKDFYVEYENSSFLANAEIAGENIKAGVKGKNIDLEFLADAFDLPVPMSGAADIGADYEKDALKEAASVKAYSSGGTVTEIPYDNFEIEIAAENNIAEIKKAALYKRNEIEVSVSGFFPFGSGLNSSSQTAQSPVNISYSVEDQKMALLKYVSEGNVEPRSGRLSLKGTVKGSFDKISNNGQFTIAGGAFDSQKYVGKVRDFNADISIVDNLITVNKFFAKSGSGLLTGSGTVFLESFTPQKFDLRFYTDDKGIPVKIPELAIPSFIGSSVLLRDYSSGEPRFDVTLTGSAEKPKIAGWVLLENTRFTFPSADKSSGGGGGVLPEGTEFDLELRAAKNTRYENSFADAWINGSLFLRGAKGSLAADGVIDTQRGVIQYLGIEFNIINVKIEVIGNHVYITAEGETEAYSPNKAGSEIIVLAIDRSDINSLNVRFYSRDDPALDSQTALARVTKTEQTTAVSSSERILGIISEFDLRQQALRLFDSGFATPLTRTVLRRTGLVDNFKVSYVSADTRDPALEQDTSLASLLLGTKYSVEKNLTNQFLLGYSLTFDRYNQMERSLDLKHEIEMRYRIGSNLFLSGSYELESESSLHRPDRKLMLQHQIRFGLPVRKQPGD